MPGTALHSGVTDGPLPSGFQSLSGSDSEGFMAELPHQVSSSTQLNYTHIIKLTLSQAWRECKNK